MAALLYNKEQYLNTMQIPDLIKRNSRILARGGGAVIVGLFIAGVAWTGTHKQHDSGAQSCGACITVVSAPEVHSTYHIWLSTIGDQAGDRTTPYTMASTANYRLTYLSTAAGYDFDHWYIGYNKTTNPNKTIYFSGTTYANSTIQIVLKNTAPPGGFSLSSPGQSASSIDLKWDNSTGASKYDVKRGSVIIQSDFTGTSYTDKGLKCNTSYTYVITAKNSIGNTNSNSKTVSTSGCPAPIVGTTGGTGSTTKKTTTPNLQGSTNTPAAPDTKAPDKPVNFVVHQDETTSAVLLSWDEVTDDSGIKAYQLDRSTDKNNWQTLSSDITNPYYSDTTTSFSTQYFYRVRATDNAGNNSDFANTDITTQSFAANAFPDKDNTINDETNNLAVNLPSGALAEPALCSVAIDATVLPPNLKGYRTVDGPYVLACKNLSGADVTIDKPFTISWTTSAQARNGIKTVDYFGYKHDAWQPLKVASRDKKNRTDKVNVEGATTFAAMGRIKHTSIWLKILLILLILAGIGALVIFVMIMRVRRQQQSRYDDYIHKEYGL